MKNRLPENCVIILWGEIEVSYLYDYSRWSKENIIRLLEKIEVFEFSTPEESEAFRLGLCVVRTGKDFDEVAPECYKSMLEIAGTNKKKIRKTMAG